MGEPTTLELNPHTFTNEAGVEAQYLEELFALPSYEKTPQVISVAEMAEDERIRTKTAKFIGEVLASKLVETDVSIERPINSLYEGIKQAAKGNTTARAMVEANAATDIIERSIKTGFVVQPIEMNLTLSGRLVQHDQTLDSVQANSLRQMAAHKIMGPRTRAETRNSHRITALNEEGYFNEYSFVVFSLAEDEAGFFTETMSCAIQVTSKTENGLKLESAFVSGIKSPGESRHDLETIKRLYLNLGVDIEGKTPAEIIDTPLLVHNSLIPNGAIDLVKFWDDAAGGTFFGEDKPRQDYLEYAAECKNRQKEFGLKGKLIARDLIDQADNISSLSQAIKLLDKTSEKYAVLNAVVDDSIDVRVFGDKAAKHIERSRKHLSQGNLSLAEEEIDFALLTAQSYSCPTSMGASGEDCDEFGPLTFTCSHCGNSNRRLPGRENFLSACQHCDASAKCV